MVNLINVLVFYSNMFWKKQSYWVKGLIIGSIITIIPLLFMFGCWSLFSGEGKMICILFILHLYILSIPLQNVFNHVPANFIESVPYYLFSILFYPSFGALIGLIIDKIKK